MSGYLNIQSSASLINVDGLANLISIGGYLQIYDNDVLTNLDGLVNITSVGGVLQIYYNNALTNLDGLANITSVGLDLRIQNNDALTNCCGIYTLLAVPSAVSGTISISGNPSACSSQTEIEEECSLFQIDVNFNNPPCGGLFSGSLIVITSGPRQSPFTYYWDLPEVPLLVPAWRQQMFLPLIV